MAEQEVVTLVGKGKSRGLPLQRSLQRCSGTRGAKPPKSGGRAPLRLSVAHKYGIRRQPGVAG